MLAEQHLARSLGLLNTLARTSLSSGYLLDQSKCWTVVYVFSIGWPCLGGRCPVCIGLFTDRILLGRARPWPLASRRANHKHVNKFCLQPASQYKHCSPAGRVGPRAGALFRGNLGLAAAGSRPARYSPGCLPAAPGQPASRTEASQQLSSQPPRLPLQCCIGCTHKIAHQSQCDHPSF